MIKHNHGCHTSVVNGLLLRQQSDVFAKFSFPLAQSLSWGTRMHKLKVCTDSLNEESIEFPINIQWATSIFTVAMSIWWIQWICNDYQDPVRTPHHHLTAGCWFCLTPIHIKWYPTSIYVELLLIFNSIDIKQKLLLTTISFFQNPMELRAWRRRRFNFPSENSFCLRSIIFALLPTIRAGGDAERKSIRYKVNSENPLPLFLRSCFDQQRDSFVSNHQNSSSWVLGLCY